MHLDPTLVRLFEHLETPQTLLNGIREFYSPNIEREIEKLELTFSKLTYDGQDPVIWVAEVRELIAKLTARNAALSDRSIRNTILKALKNEPEYRMRVEIIRVTQPNISPMDLWTHVRRFPYPLNRKYKVIRCNLSCHPSCI